MRTSGLVLDVYDDVHGDVIRGLFSSLEQVPELMKTAHALSGDERAQLPDDAFALVLVNGEERLRKFACTDPGNVALSVFYFLENGHKLPEEAQKVAASNLVIASGWYDLEVPETLEKVAFGGMILNAVKNNPVGTAMTAMTAPSLVAGTRDNIRANLGRVRAGEAMEGIAGGLGALHKHAEVSGTHVMPNSANPTAKPTAPVAGTIKKTAHLEPVIEVTMRERAWVETEKKASRFALPSIQRYPLDSYTHVKQAADYFSEYHRHFEPEQRQEYCTNLIKRASELNIELPEQVRLYAGTSELYTKEAELLVFASDNDEFTDIDGNDVIHGHELKRFALTGARQVMTVFGPDVAEEFQKDPIGIYKSMPKEQKKLIRRMATDNAPGSELNV